MTSHFLGTVATLYFLCAMQVNTKFKRGVSIAEPICVSFILAWKDSVQVKIKVGTASEDPDSCS